MTTAVLIPTRGIIYTRCINSVLTGVPGLTTDLILVSEGLKIPEAQNYLVKKGLSTSVDNFLMMEEDNVLPEGVFDKMVASDGDIVCVDYPVDNGTSTVCRKNGEILWCGLGCTLVRRHVFEQLSKPIFRTDQSLLITDLDKWEYELQDVPNKYGGHDILFGYYARLKGFKITQVNGVESPHLRSDLFARNQNNAGFRNVYELPPVSKRQDY